MATNTSIFPRKLDRDAMRAYAGSNRVAGATVIQAAIGAAPVLTIQSRAASGDTEVLRVVLPAALLPLDDGDIVVPTNYLSVQALLTAVTDSTANLWLRVGKADHSAYLEARIARAGAAFAIDGNLVAASPVSAGSVIGIGVTKFGFPRQVPVGPAEIDRVALLDGAVSDMKLRNDFVLKGYEGYSVGWYVGPGYCMMGNVPNTSNTPAYWKNSNPGRYPQVCNAIMPWFVIFDGTGNQVAAPAIDVQRISLTTLSKATNLWTTITSVGASIGGFLTLKAGLFGEAGQAQITSTGAGAVRVQMPSDSSRMTFHGWSERKAISPNDIAAVHVEVWARLAQTYSNAQWGIQVGADYYRDVNTNWDIIVPSVATARTRSLTSTLQRYTMTTLSNVGVQEPGGGITETQFRSNPPPVLLAP